MLDFWDTATYWWTSFCFFAAVVDDHGNLLAETENVLYCAMPPDYEETLVNVTDEMADAILEAASDISHGGRFENVFIRSAKLAEKDGKYVPVSAEVCLEATEKYIPEYKTAVLSELPAAVTVEWPRLEFFYPFLNKKMSNTIFMMRDRVRGMHEGVEEYYRVNEERLMAQPSYLSDVMETCVWCCEDVSVSGPVYEVDEVQAFPVKCADETYYFICQYFLPLPVQVFNEHSTAFVTAGAIALFVYFAALITVFAVLRKREENANRIPAGTVVQNLVGPPEDMNVNIKCKRSPGEILCLISIGCVVAAYMSLALDFVAEIPLCVVFAVAGEFTGLLGILHIAVNSSRRGTARPESRLLLILTVIAVLLPPLTCWFIYKLIMSSL